MKTHIRRLRRLRGWTLQELADRVGTTAQTVQRLETANMTVSTEWLEKFAAAFGVGAAELLDDERTRRVEFLGLLGRDAILADRADPKADPFVPLDIPAERPVAARLANGVGRYAGGSVVIANKLTGTDIANILGKDALVAPVGGPVMLRRVIAGRDGTYTLVPIEAEGDVRYDQELEWAGRIVMAVQYF